MRVRTNINAGKTTIVQINLASIFQTAIAHAQGPGAVALAVNLAVLTQINVNAPVSVSV